MVHLLEIPGMADYQIYQMAESMLERNRTGAGLNFEPKSVKQGRIGDCYFLSAAAGVVEIYPELIYRLFVFEKNHLHFFGAKLFIDGCWRTIALDARFPLDINGNFCGAQSRKG